MCMQSEAVSGGRKRWSWPIAGRLKLVLSDVVLKVCAMSRLIDVPSFFWLFLLLLLLAALKSQQGQFYFFPPKKIIF